MDLFCKSEGNGPPLVLLHGTGGSWEAWASVIPFLAPHRRVFAIDLPGLGASPQLPARSSPTVPALATAVGEWMTETDLERPHVAGNSLGGAVALELAKENRVSSATALSPIGFSNGWEFAYGAASLCAGQRLHLAAHAETTDRAVADLDQWYGEVDRPKPRPARPRAGPPLRPHRSRRPGCRPRPRGPSPWRQSTRPSPSSPCRSP